MDESTFVIDSDGDILTIFKSNNISFQKSQLLDSACVTHICSQKYFFDLNDKLISKLSRDDDSIDGGHECW